jgi:hypothetical protein
MDVLGDGLTGPDCFQIGEDSTLDRELGYFGLFSFASLIAISNRPEFSALFSD